MSRGAKRFLLGLAAAGALLTAVLMVEVQLARTGPSLADEDGSRPEGLVVGRNQPGRPIEIVWIGDSTTTGVGVTDFADSMAHRTSASAADAVGRPISLTVLGVSGAQVHEALDEQTAALADVPADVVVISVGGNDVTHLTRESTFRSRYRMLLARVAEVAPQAEVVVVGIPDMGSVPRFAQPLRFIAGTRASQLDTEVEAAARDVGHQYVDLAGETGPRFAQDPDRYFSDDRFHPGVQGHGLWAEAVRGEVVAAAARVAD